MVKQTYKFLEENEYDVKILTQNGTGKSFTYQMRRL